MTCLIIASLGPDLLQIGAGHGAPMHPTLPDGSGAEFLPSSFIPHYIPRDYLPGHKGLNVGEALFVFIYSLDWRKPSL